MQISKVSNYQHSQMSRFENGTISSFQNFKKSQLQMSNISKFQHLIFKTSKFKVSKFQNCKTSKIRSLEVANTLKSMVRIPSKLVRFLDSRKWNNMFQWCPYCSCIRLSVLVINTGPEGPDLVTFLVVPKTYCNMFRNQN